jgi:Ca2+-transporting ATPase
MLSIAAVVSLALGLFQDFGATPETISCAGMSRLSLPLTSTFSSPILGPDGSVTTCQLPKVDWVEGVAIIIAIIIVSLLLRCRPYYSKTVYRWM